MRSNLALTLILSFALLVKGLIPIGWMPTGNKAFEIAICTGVEMQSVWLDDKGKLHKQDPSKKSSEKPCAFAGLASAADLPNSIAAPLPVRIAATSPRSGLLNATVGQGLAAPPPPATGPPLLI